MHRIEFLNAAGGVLDKMTSAVGLADAIADAKAQFSGARYRNPAIVGFRLTDNEGRQVWSWAG
jgi:hypothetical protein